MVMAIARLVLIFGFGVVLASVSPVSAAWSETYVAPSQLPPSFLLPPPAENTAAWKHEIEAVRAAQKHISPSDLADLREEQHVRLELITPVMGADFNRERLPQTFALLDNVLADTVAVTHADKRFWHTRRPYLTDPHVKLLVDPLDNNPAYPSGHTSESRVLAEVLGMLAPDRLESLRARADSIAWHRVQAGVHYPNDLTGGRMLAMLMVGALSANSDFQDDLAAARDEMSEAE